LSAVAILYISLMVLLRCAFVASAACMAAGLSPAGQPKMRTEVTASGQAREVVQPSSLESAPLRTHTQMARIEVQPTGEVNGAPMSDQKRDKLLDVALDESDEKRVKALLDASAGIKASANSELDMMAQTTGSDCNGACEGLQYCPEVNVKSGSYYRKCSGTVKKGFAWKPRVMAKSMNGVDFNVQLYHEENPERQWHAGTCASTKEESCKSVKCFSIDNMVLTEDHTGSMCVAIKCSYAKSSKWYRASSCKVGFNVKWEQVKIETAAAVSAEARRPSFAKFAGLFLGVVILVGLCIARSKSQKASSPDDNYQEGGSSGDESPEKGKGLAKGSGKGEGKGFPKGSGKGEAGKSAGGYQREAPPQVEQVEGFQIGGRKKDEPPSQDVEVVHGGETDEDEEQQSAEEGRPGQLGDDGQVITF